MSRSSRKGFLLSLDAIIATGLILSLALFIGGLSMTYQSPELRYQRLYYAGKDLMLLLENARIDQLQEFEAVQYYQDIGILSDADQDKTLLDIVGSMWSTENATLHSYAANMTADILNSTIPSNYNYMVVLGGDTIYQSGPGGGGYLARLSSIISGIDRGRPIDGYFARAYPAKVGKTGSEYYYFGGYVGEGNITALMELPDYDSIKTMNMELDISSNFTLIINNVSSGYYEKQTNETMRSNRWDVSNSYFGNLHNGTNTIQIDFDEPYSYIGGGYMRIVYNTSDITADLGNSYGDNASKRYYLPGIEGIINLYDSVYVPGVLKGMKIYLHYESLIPGLTAYLSLGNVPVYENNYTGEIAIMITNTSILGNLSNSSLDYSYLSGRTVPLRLGFRNISYVLGEAGAADVVMITDRTGSMTACDVDTSYASACDSFPPYHDRRSLVAQESDRAFVNTILTAEGRNYVGLIGYGERHGMTCSFHEISDDNSSLQARIDDYNYGGSWQDCGWTCTSCGVVGATELLQEKETLYNLTLLEDIDRNVYSMSGGTVSRTVTLTLDTLNNSRFVKSRLSVLVDGDDTDDGYQQCVFINGNYLGRACRSSEGSDDWHTCSYAVDKDWVDSGSNSIQLTKGNTGGCLTSGGADWQAKDIKLSVWEYRVNGSVVSVNMSSDEIMLNMISHYSFANLWESDTDYPNPVDFTSGFNSTGNTFGNGLGDDGWDWEAQTYGFQNDCNFNFVNAGKLEVEAEGDSDASCAYGIQLEITAETYDLIQAGGKIAVSLFYEWDGNDDPFESADQVWIKGRWTSPNSGVHDLGSDLDTGHSNPDATMEIATEDNPDTEMSGSFYQDVTSWVESTGTYYLDFGGKLDRSWSNERGYFMFDDIAVSIYNESTGEPVVAMSFPGVNMSRVKAATLEFESRYINPDKRDCVYVNDYHITALDYQEANGSTEWQDIMLDIPVMFLQEGENEIEFTAGTDRGCNRTGDNDQWMARNVKLSLVHSDEMHDYRRKKSMLIMSDGEANTVIGDCRNYDSGSCPSVPAWLTPSEETVQKACEAHDKYNISIYTVVFGNAGQDAEDMLEAAACCDNCSNYFNSSSADELVEIYSRIAQGILNASFRAQTIELNLDVGVISTLYSDSYIEVNYSSSIDPPEYGEIAMNFEGTVFENMSGSSPITDDVNKTKEGWFYVPSNVEAIEARVTSYSSRYWTDRLYVRNSTNDWTRVYWLEDFGAVNYTVLGDPFIVDIPIEHVTNGDNNSVRIGTGFSATNGTGGSPDSRVIYTGRISGIALEGYSDVFPRANGSTVDVYYDIDGDNASDGFLTIQVGPYPSDIFDPNNDSVDNAFMRLMDTLNVVWDTNPGGIGNGSVSNPYDGGITGSYNPIDFQIPPDIRFDSAAISGVPSMWGPVELEVRIWN